MKDESSLTNDTTIQVPERSLEEILNNPGLKQTSLDIDAIAARFGGYEDE